MSFVPPKCKVFCLNANLHMLLLYRKPYIKSTIYLCFLVNEQALLSFSYFRTTEQNKFGFVQFDRPKIGNHLLTPESYESYEL